MCHLGSAEKQRVEGAKYAASNRAAQVGPAGRDQQAASGERLVGWLEGQGVGEWNWEVDKKVHWGEQESE